MDKDLESFMIPSLAMTEDNNEDDDEEIEDVVHNIQDDDEGSTWHIPKNV